MEWRDFDLTDPDAAAFCPSCGAGYTIPGGECADCEEELWPRSRIEKQLKEEVESELDAPVENGLAVDESVEPDYNLSDPDAVSFCPSCGAGYTAMAVRCQDCDRELVPKSWVEFQAQAAAKAKGETSDAVHLCEILGRIKAGRLELELAEAGIRFFTRPQHLLGVGGGLHGAIDFFVGSKDLEKASAPAPDPRRHRRIVAQAALFTSTWHPDRARLSDGNRSWPPQRWQTSGSTSEPHWTPIARPAGRGPMAKYWHGDWAPAPSTCAGDSRRPVSA